MNRETFKKKLPTVAAYLEKRRERARNRLPRHLRPLSRGPVYFQMVLNAAIFITLSWLMINRDDFLTEAAPALGLVVCLLLLIYTLIKALQLKQQFQKAPGQRLTAINFWMMVAAGLLFPASVAYFLP
jgi:hypothetical protein